MDRFEVEELEGQGVAVSMARLIPERSLPLEPSLVKKVADDLLACPDGSTIAELLDQDLALFRSIHESQSQKRELIRLNSELEESRQAILALHVELSERADCLRSESELKTWFLARISHELRTPLASILSLARLLLNRADGELAVEQERQVSFIFRAAHDLSSLLNDLIELARIEAGRESLHLATVHIPEFFAALRGMFRPLIPPSSPVVVVFEDPGNLPPLWTDEAKLSQVMRNFLSNALKFTTQGEIRVKAEAGPGDSVVFSVTDTGLGILPEELEKVFQEFRQVESPDHPCPTGTGLGLPLARKLAGVLGGRVDVRSNPGVGSTFTATIPIRSNDPPGPFPDDRLIP
jgi:signal transduction histidine kinase